MDRERDERDEREAFGAYVRDTYGREVKWNSNSGIPVLPFLYAESGRASLGSEWQAWLARAQDEHEAEGLLATLQRVRELIRGHEAQHIATDHTGKESLGEFIDKAIRAHLARRDEKNEEGSPGPGSPGSAAPEGSDPSQRGPVRTESEGSRGPSQSRSGGGPSTSCQTCSGTGRYCVPGFSDEVETRGWKDMGPCRDCAAPESLPPVATNAQDAKPEPVDDAGGGEVERIARVFHEAYENAAEVHGWETQERCRVPFDALPVKNRAVMMHATRAAIAAMKEKTDA